MSKEVLESKYGGEYSLHRKYDDDSKQSGHRKESKLLSTLLGEMDNLEDMVADIKGDTKRILRDDHKDYEDDCKTESKYLDNKYVVCDSPSKSWENRSLQLSSKARVAQARSHMEMLIEKQASKQSKWKTLLNSDGKPLSKLEMKKYVEQKAADLREVFFYNFYPTILN
jgi:hypothetical protein